MTKVIKAYVNTDKGQLHYRQAGNGEPLVLLQPLPFGSLMFDSVLPAIATKGYSCFAFDLMGYGRSDFRRSHWTIEDFAENIADALERLRLEPRFIVGGHFSGVVAVELALVQPTRVERLMLDGVPMWTTDQRLQKIKGIPSPTPIAADGSTTQRLWKQTIGMLRAMDPQAKLTLENENEYMEAFVAFLRTLNKPGTARSFFEYPAEAKLAQVKQPTLIVTSPTDSLESHLELAAKALPTAQTYRLSNTHPLYQLTREPDTESVREFVSVLHNFLSRRSL